MKQRFTYLESEALKIQEVSLIGDFNQWDSTANRLNKTEAGQWEVEADIPQGRYLYQFLVNGELALNDPEANIYFPDSKKQLKSVLIINEQGERLYVNEQYHVSLTNYCISNEAGDLSRPSHTSFVQGVDKQAVVGMGFQEITGIHQLTAAWYTPDGLLCDVTEHALYQPKEEKEARLWFRLNLKESLPAGVWQIIIFIDGKVLHKEQIMIKKLQYDTAEAVRPLPLGSIVKLKNQKTRLMIFGINQKNKMTQEVWDYIGCIYPEGHIGARYTVLFNHDQIGEIEFKGL